MIETKHKVFEKDREGDQENNEDVVIESESRLNISAVKTSDKPVQAAVKAAPVVPVPPAAKLASNLPKLIRMVPPVPFELLMEIPVFFVHVESTKRVWVCREDDQVGVSLMMDKLAGIEGELKPAHRMKRGAVYGARFSQDDAMYRAVLKEVEEGHVVQFIDFGNMEPKEERELFDIPYEVGSSPAAAVSVDIKSDLEETEENRTLVEDMLEGDILTVTVVEDGATFKMDGKEVQFNQHTRQNTSVEMITIGDIKEDSNKILPESEAKTVSVQLTSESTSPVPPPKKKASPPEVVIDHTKYLSTATGLADQPQEAAAVSSPEVHPVEAQATVNIPQPVPTRTFAKVISALQSDLLSRSKASKEGSKDNSDQDSKKQPRDREESKEVASLPGLVPAGRWTAGDQVVAKWPDGVWRRATIKKMDPSSSQAKVVAEGVEEAMVSLVNVRPHSLPVEALNLIDQGLLKDNIVRQKGDATCEKKGVFPAVVGKVKEWMDKNLAQFNHGDVSTGLEVKDSLSLAPDKVSKLSLEQIPLPPSQDLASYSRTSKGSLHIQSVLNSSNPELNSLVLSSLLTSSPGPLSLMTSPKSSYVIQKLIIVLPSPQLQ